MDDFIDAKTFAKKFGMSVRKLDYLIENGDVPRPIKIGNSRRWSIAELEQWISQKLEEAKLPPSK
ncbi:AlpA family transcriptional regulator [Deefgea sp. CFH1-16]|uniref:helix-turn-helix transcriptional regulator n=1 Tax=Deefgea sp. CFH1-16 TaxID=2675457 RepID=UPI0015F5D191|nr:hypothetical protein [Deefgea sp. CFH1-16]MBM5575313.1 hypothetical protein [Deefgea sp. CFH1-16]